MEEEVNNVNVNANTKKKGTSGVGTFFFLVIVVAIIVASLICGILEYNYHVEAEINNLQSQIDELKKINTQMESNYNDALNVNAGLEDDEEDTTVETTDETTSDTTVSNEVADTTNTVQ